MKLLTMTFSCGNFFFTKDYVFIFYYQIVYLMQKNLPGLRLVRVTLKGIFKELALWPILSSSRDVRLSVCF